MQNPKARGDIMALKIDYAPETKNTYKITKRKADYNGEVYISEELFKDGVRISRDSFAPVISDEEVKNLIIGNSLLLVAYNAENMQRVGFAASYYEKNACYFSSSAIMKTEQGNGLYYIFNRLRIRDGIGNGFNTFTVTTQNPKVEKGIASAMNSFLEEGFIDGYSVQRDPIRGYYGRMLTTEVPRSSDERINRPFSYLNYGRGDAFYISFLVRKRRKFF